MKSYKSKKPHETFEEVEESFGSEVMGRVGSEAKNVGNEFLKQLLGLNDGSAGEKVLFERKLSKTEKGTPEKESAKRKKRERIEPGIDYHSEYFADITRFSERGLRRETIQESRQVQQIMAEIRKLASSTKLLQAEFGLITVEEAPVNPGRYYVNFFEWMLIMVKQARQKVEDSKSWLDTVKGKGKKKAGYWDKVKKHNTSYSQSNERFVATSTG